MLALNRVLVRALGFGHEHEHEREHGGWVMTRWWMLLALGGCDDRAPHHEVEVDAAVDATPITLPCSGQVFPRSSGHRGQLVWDGQSFILGYNNYGEGTGLEAWSPDGVMRWHHPLPNGPVTLWRENGQIRALHRDEDATTFALTVSPEGEVAPLAWPPLAGYYVPEVLPASDGALWLVEARRVWRLVGQAVVFEEASNRDAEATDYNGPAAVGPDGRLTVLIRRYREDVEHAESLLVTYETDGARQDTAFEPDFLPGGLAYDAEGRLLVVGSRTGATMEVGFSSYIQGFGGRLQGLGLEPLDYDHPFACPSDLENNRYFDGLTAMPGGDWLVHGTLCSDGFSWTLWLLRLAPDGAVRWQARLGPMNENGLRGVAVADDGTIALSGWSVECCPDTFGNDVPWLMFVDPEGRCLDAVR